MSSAAAATSASSSEAGGRSECIAKVSVDDTMLRVVAACLRAYASRCEFRVLENKSGRSCYLNYSMF